MGYQDEEPAIIGAAHLMFCHERGRLGDSYAEAASAFSDAANEYMRRVGSWLTEDHERVAQAKQRADQARIALARHRAEHGC